MLVSSKGILVLACGALWASPPVVTSSAGALQPEQYRHYVEAFNRDDPEGRTNLIANVEAWDWMKQDIPFFESSDKSIEEMYYFRWWEFRKHIRQTPAGFVITEFLPDVPWAGAQNTVSASAGHHFYEGRWLRDPEYLREYAR
ncbi:MAG: hypothetical protein ABSH56_08400, partial [Bryobacteraceae bacterium]